MAKVIGVMGESGSGKTTAMRTLNPKETFYIDCDKKGLSWKGWREQYNLEKKNYWCTDSPSVVMQLLTKINDKENKDLEGIKNIVIDTINGVMVAEEMRNAKVQGYGKWTDLAQYVWEIFDFSLTMREELTVIIICHSITDTDDNGIVFTHIRTNGRKLEKIVLESKLTTVLMAACKDGAYVFRTKADRSSVKTPLGAFESDEIENDMQAVLDALQGY